MSSNNNNDAAVWDKFVDSFNEPSEPPITLTIEQFYARFSTRPRYVETITDCELIPETENHEVWRQTCRRCGHTQLFNEYHTGSTPFFCRVCKAGIEDPTLLDHVYTMDIREREQAAREAAK